MSPRCRVRHILRCVSHKFVSIVMESVPKRCFAIEGYEQYLFYGSFGRVVCGEMKPRYQFRDDSWLLAQDVLSIRRGLVNF